MSRTGLSPADIAESFRDRCGDGSVEWTYTPMQTWVLLDAADMLDENAKLRELVRHLYTCNEYCDREDGGGGCSACPYQPLECDCGFEERLLELGIEVDA
jgi:hypothetical protein